ncbi:MAG: hypothetical protein KKA55_01805 [Proteobacteria bacterium]|nr:hypothetical protein [Pseudomonadota bacterium]MBU1594253.1 hypothetical protein [Pseudomonadota bacterium]
MPPKKGESKQDFLGRCAREKRATGMSEDKAMAACAADWNQARMAAVVDDNMLHLAGAVDITLADQANDGEAQAPDRFVILAYTGKLIDWGWHRFIIDLKGMKLAKAKVPCLHGHYSGGIVGTIDKSSQDANGFYVTGEFSRVPTSKGPEVLEHAREGFPWQASVGVQGVKVLHVDKGATHKVNGQTVEGPCDVWLESTVFEVSFVPFGADDDTAAIAMSHDGSRGDGKTISPEDNTMPHTAAPGSQELSGQQPPAAVPTPAPATAPDAAALDAAKAESAKLAAQAQQDAAALLTHGQNLNLSMKDVQGVLALGLPKAAATEKLLELAAAKNPPVGTGVLVMGADEADKVRLAATHGVMLRMGLQPKESLAPGHENFRGLRMHELAKFFLERARISTLGMSPAQAAEKILRLSSGGMSTSDFAAVFRDVAHKRLLKSYIAAGSNWRSYCNIVPASDFKTIYGVTLSEAPDLDLVNEHGEYKYARFREKQESYHIAKHGKMVRLTLEMIINDDLRAFQKLPQLLGAAASRRESDIIYGLINSNPVMAEDGKALFCSDHGNLASGGDIGGVDSDTLTAARQAVFLQQGLNGSDLNLELKHLLLPSTYMTSAEVLLTSAALPESGMSAGVKNVWAGRLEPHFDARMDRASSTAWIGVADPAQADTVEVAFLDGVEEPAISEHEDYKTDCIDWKVRHIFGAGIMDYRPFYKNAGA